MHIVTTYKGASHYYGFYDVEKKPDYRSRKKPHRGVDVHAKEGSPCFAIHGGWVCNYGSKSSGAGYFIRFYLEKCGSGPYAQYFHFKEHIKDLNKKHVMAGRKVGESGRTGYSSPRPSHLHFEIRKSGGSSVEPNQITSEKFFPSSFCDEANAICIPSNKLPLILPCKCEYGKGYKVPINCNSSKAVVLKMCWAVQEYPNPKKLASKKGDAHEIIKNKKGLIHFICPYIFRKSADETHLKAKLQAYLKFIYHNKGKGKIPNSKYFKDLAIDAGKETRNAIIGLMKAYSSTSNPTDSQAKDFISIYMDAEKDAKKIDDLVKGDMDTKEIDDHVNGDVDAKEDAKGKKNDLVKEAYEWLTHLIQHKNHILDPEKNEIKKMEGIRISEIDHKRPEIKLESESRKFENVGEKKAKRNKRNKRNKK